MEGGTQKGKNIQREKKTAKGEKKKREMGKKKAVRAKGRDTAGSSRFEGSS